MQKNQLIYGRHPVIDAIENGKSIDKVFLQQGIRGDLEKEIRHLSKTYNFPVQVVPKEKLNQFTRGNHQGLVGVISLIQYYKIEDLLPLLFEKEQAPLLLVLDSITDVRNMGAIARSAECLGAGGLIIPKKKTAAINAEGIKTSAGALAKIPVCRAHSLVQTVAFLQNSGVNVIASSLKATKRIEEIDLDLPTAILIGSEDKGVHPALLKEANEQFIIPQMGSTDSLNVSVAAGIMLYEAARQRMKQQ